MTVTANTWVRSLLAEAPSVEDVLVAFGVDLGRSEHLDTTLYELSELLDVDHGALARALRVAVRRCEDAFATDDDEEDKLPIEFTADDSADEA